MRAIMSAAIILLFIVSGSFGFGKNKVQYSRLDWEYLNSSHFRLYYHQDQGDLPQITYRWLENMYSTLSGQFRFTHESPVPVIIYETPNLFEQTNIITEIIPEGVGGFTELFKNRVAMPFNGSYSEYRQILHHEMVHAFVFGIFGEGSPIFRSAVMQVPLWFHEGLAEFLSSGWNSQADMFMIDQTINGSIPLPGPQMGGYLAYKGGQSFLHFLHSTRGENLFYDFLLKFKETKSLDSAIETTYGKNLRQLGEEWRRELKRLYWPELGKRIPPERNAEKITEGISNQSRFNLRPRLSPDGEYVAFFSDLRDYTHILVTDRNGNQKYRINQRAHGTGVESFYPFRSGLCWSADGKKLAFVAKKQGRDQIRIVNIREGKLYKTIDFPFSHISSPDWSHDNENIVFTAIKQGRQNIYLYNLITDETVKLTDNILSQFNPRFSPDGQEVIFSVQDTSGAAPLLNAPFISPSHNLALVNISTKESRLLTDTQWNDQQPSFSADGKNIIFVSDRNGINNLYIAPLSHPDSARALTDYIGSSSSPDWCRKTSSVVFDYYELGSWNVWLIENPEDKLLENIPSPTMWKKSLLDSSHHFFNPKTDKVSSGTDEEKGLDSSAATAAADSSPSDTFISQSSPEESWQPTGIIPYPSPYTLKFTPDLITFGLGVNTHYGVAGQWLLTLSDIMGDHRITMAGDVQGRFDEYMHLYLSYFYLKNRINVGAGAYYNKDYSYESMFNRIYHDTDWGAFFQLSYPFSKFSRTDFQLFARRITREPYRDDESETITSHTILPNLTIVYDDILWGITGPLTGRRARARLTISPPFDFIDQPFLSFDSDIRSYLHINKRFVWANRLAFGASIPLGEGPTARRFFLGGNDNWFNYQVNINNYRNNVNNTFYSEFMTPFRGWNYMDITGERALLYNTEFRFPFIREFSLVWPLPIAVRYVNGAVFADVGNAWDREDQDNFLPFPRKLYGGVGLGMRANLGMFVLRYDRGWPTDWREITGPAVNYFSLGAEF
ncbi:WD40-like protein beta Propeller containing protein [Chitinispirillum alkaliphilum]|nr:WD40-like protein beta Propeller containing protein [Chitinispirillum alkaliphilum]